MDAHGSGYVEFENCVGTEAWTWGGVSEADEDSDAGISSRRCEVVGGVKIPGAAGGDGGRSENATKKSMLTVRSPGWYNSSLA